MTDFDDWLRATFAETDGFTVLIVVLGLGGGRVDLLKSAHLHVIGDDIDWPRMAEHLDGSGMAWGGVVMFRAGREGLVADDIARDRLDQLARALNGDRTLIRDGEFFNRDGLRMRLDDAEPQPPVLN
ncbi:hypothetical protein EYF88_13495 [Paracoccus sediminis]|uniref:Uncharacterized protein n=1 Tax=Paracoccus sediminis TaxID=1214787 RepID=A0A238XH41_9RHOB|nr:hypothetical protein [Paracoccus sediminis]TBN48513.1 hypothetical protein EYF88_13495 [Paracoccus sediminis]SNR58315.1 hypothetical protein SAMN06265378_11054 [Paracoccus sediminis]